MVCAGFIPGNGSSGNTGFGVFPGGGAGFNVVGPCPVEGPRLKATLWDSCFWGKRSTVRNAGVVRCIGRGDEARWNEWFARCWGLARCGATSAITGIFDLAGCGGRKSIGRRSSSVVFRSSAHTPTCTSACNPWEKIWMILCGASLQVHLRLRRRQKSAGTSPPQIQDCWSGYRRRRA